MKIAFEGIDLSGKTTQVTLLSNELNIKALKFPRHENLLIQSYLKGRNSFSKDASFFIFLADIIDGVRKAMGQKIILDRYLYSTIAYAQTISFENAKKIVELSPVEKADIVFYIDINIDEYKKRVNRKLDRYEEDMNIQKTARERYLSMAKEGFFAKKWITIDGTKSVEEIYNIIKNNLHDFI